MNLTFEALCTLVHQFSTAIKVRVYFASSAFETPIRVPRCARRESTNVRSKRFKTDVLALGLLALVVFRRLEFYQLRCGGSAIDAGFPPRQVPTNLCGISGATLAFYARQFLGLGIWVLLWPDSWDFKLFRVNLSVEPVRLWLVCHCWRLVPVQSSICSCHIIRLGLRKRRADWSVDRVILQEHFSSAGVTMLVFSL